MQKYITIQYCRPLCTTKEPQTRIIESLLRLLKDAKTTLKLLSEEGPGSIYQLCYSVPTICIKK